MGIAGAAIATVISQGFSGLLCVIYCMKKRPILKVSLQDFSLKENYFSQLIPQGISMSLMISVISTGTVILQTGINSLGAEVIAGYTAGRKFIEFFLMPGGALSETAAAFTSQNYGAQNFDRCRKTFFYCMGLSSGICILCSVVFTLFRLPLSHIYSNDPEAIFFCAERILKVELVQFLVNSYEITSGVLRGLGYSLMPAVITLVGSCGLRLVWISTVFQKFRSYDSIIAVYPVSWTVTGTAMILAYAIIWKKISDSRLTAEK